ncbi:hypothetical protein DN068_21075 [Taibaiella soli]|uniref:Uncharacterized protein n=1 Tax=Taibaiella soli TaxID=1649169 RepID=A0A2W2ABD2_9BACT|nr:hypothetical protein DN068_21075 [Taibaiella soli]
MLLQGTNYWSASVVAKSLKVSRQRLFRLGGFQFYCLKFKDLSKRNSNFSEVDTAQLALASPLISIFQV